MFLLYFVTVLPAFVSCFNTTHIPSKELENDDQFVFKVCVMVMEVTEWNYMSIISIDYNDMNLPQNFMKVFHNKVSPISLTESLDLRPSSKAVLLICGNVSRLHSLLSKKRPIWVSNVFYVILVRELPCNCTNLFEDMWLLHRITSVLLIGLGNVRKIASYNPFSDELTEENIDSPNALTGEIRKAMRRKMINLNGYPIQVVMFPTRLKAIPQPDGTYSGTDGIILQTLAKKLNFTPVFSQPRDGHKYGWMEENGTFTGAIGDILNGYADIAFNGVFIKDYHSKEIQFTMPIHFDQVCFVVPKAPMKPPWKTMFLTFDLTIWISLVIVFWLTLMAWYLVIRINERYVDSTLLGINLYRTLLMMPTNRIPHHYSDRIVTVSVLFFGFIVASSFQGSMVKFLSYATYENDYATIEELAASDLKIMSASLNLKEMFETDENPIMSSMLAKFQWAPDKDILGEIVEYKNAASIGRKGDIEEKIATSYVQDNRVLLHIVNECPRSYHIAYIVPAHSPFLVVFNDFINNLVETGITKSWFIHSKPFQPLSEYHTVAETRVVFGMENVIIAFIILALGCGMSGVVLACEVIVFRYMKRAPPKYPRKEYLMHLRKWR